MEHKWWRFWSADSWREWWRRRPAWNAYRSQARRLDSAISDGEARLSSTNSKLAKTEQQLAWAGEVRSQDLPIKTARNETGLGAIPGVALLETRKREGKEVWTPIDHGTVYLTDKKAIFSGSKNVEFRYEKLLDQEITANGLYLSVSSRKKPHMLSGPAEKISALITASEAVGRGEEPTAPFEAKAESLRYSVADTERDLDRLREERAALVAPPRPISPAWVPLAALFVLLFVGALADTSDPQPVAVDTIPTTIGQPTTVESTTTDTATTTSLSTTKTTVSTSSTTAASVGQGTLLLDLLLSIPVELETQSGYDRDLFEVWSDADGDGCDARAEVLIRDAVEDPTIRSGCDVGAGLWYSVYDDVWLNDARQLQVDHVVALKEAWDSGAKEWDRSRRVLFGNDLTSPLTLIAVSSSSNSDKGDADPSNWLPSNQADVCRYIAAWVVIKSTWDLSMDESEFGRIRNLLQGECEGATVEDAEVVYPAAPPTTTTTATPTTTVVGSGDVIIANIRYDGPGNDVEFGDSEYVLLRNDGSGTADVGGWSLEDEANHVIRIPSGYVIQPGGELRVYSGPGDDTADKYYEGLGQAIWNNSGGDTATLRDAGGQVVDSYSYSS